MLTRTSRERC